MTPKFALARLRHLYAHLKAGRVTDQPKMADGLLSPVIQALELAQMQPGKIRILQEALFMAYEQMAAEANRMRSFSGFSSPEAEAHHNGVRQGIEEALKRFEPYLLGLRQELEAQDAAREDRSGSDSTGVPDRNTSNRK